MPWWRMISAIRARSGGPPAAASITPAVVEPVNGAARDAEGSR